MADKKNTAKTASKADKAAKSKQTKNAKEKPSFGERIKAFFSNLFKEMKKIKWADGKTVLKNTAVVLLVVLVIGLGVWITDAVLVKLRELLYTLSTGDAETAIILFKGFLASVSIL